MDHYECCCDEDCQCQIHLYEPNKIIYEKLHELVYEHLEDCSDSECECIEED